jgi:5-methylcytosine-specific restriction endonuclease McrA
MPIRPENRGLYPPDWPEISRRIRQDRAKDRCEGCGAENREPHPVTGAKVVLTVAHLDHNPANCHDDNLRAWCQKCHNSHDAPIRREGIRKRRDMASGQLVLDLAGEE